MSILFYQELLRYFNISFINYPGRWFRPQEITRISLELDGKSGKLARSQWKKIRRLSGWNTASMFPLIFGVFLLEPARISWPGYDNLDIDVLNFRIMENKEHNESRGNTGAQSNQTVYDDKLYEIILLWRDKVLYWINYFNRSPMHHHISSLLASFAVF